MSELYGQLMTSPNQLKWGDPLHKLSEERKNKLAQHLWDWKLDMVTDEKPGPFAHVPLNGLDVFWLAICAVTDAKGNASAVEQHMRELGNNFSDRFSHLYGELSFLYLQKALLIGAKLQGARLSEAHMEGADLSNADLEGAELMGTHLQGTNLRRTRLEEAKMRLAHLEGANLDEAHIEGADLREAFLDEATNLHALTISTSEHRCIRVADVRWGGVNLATLKSDLAPPLGDEQEARAWKVMPLAVELERHKSTRRGYRLNQLELFRVAVRANRQLAVALQNQGMNEEATRFAYRAQVLQRTVYRLSGWRSFLNWVGSWGLNLLAGYGYKPGRSLMAYLAIIFGFMGLYLLNSHFATPHLSWDEALVLSVSSFHGRGFFAQNITLGDAYARLAAFEAVIGLLIEISFIATFTQRFFGSK